MVRLIDYLRGLGLSNRDAKKALETGKVYLLDGPVADPIREIEPKQVSIRQGAPRVRVGLGLVVLYRDEHLAVVLKPSGMLSVSAPGRRGERTVLSEVDRSLGKALPVHRLDEGTSGLMLVARSEACQHELKEQLFRHDVERRYLGLVKGRFSAAPTTVRNRLYRDRGDGLRGSRGSGEGKEAVTHFELVQHLRGASLVRARLETGRTHQVRIHLSELGFPVLGDDLYGDIRMAPRLALHATKLGFRHPMTGELRSFVVPLSDDLERVRRDRE